MTGTRSPLLQLPASTADTSFATAVWCAPMTDDLWLCALPSYYNRRKGGHYGTPYIASVENFVVGFRLRRRCYVWDDIHKARLLDRVALAAPDKVDRVAARTIVVHDIFRRTYPRVNTDAPPWTPGNFAITTRRDRKTRDITAWGLRVPETYGNHVDVALRYLGTFDAFETMVVACASNILRIRGRQCSDTARERRKKELMSSAKSTRGESPSLCPHLHSPLVPEHRVTGSDPVAPSFSDCSPLSERHVGSSQPCTAEHPLPETTQVSHLSTSDAPTFPLEDDCVLPSWLLDEACADHPHAPPSPPEAQTCGSADARPLDMTQSTGLMRALNAVGAHVIEGVKSRAMVTIRGHGNIVVSVAMWCVHATGQRPSQECLTAMASTVSTAVADNEYTQVQGVYPEQAPRGEVPIEATFGFIVSAPLLPEKTA